MTRRRVRSGPLLALLLLGVAGLGGVATGADQVAGLVGPYRMFDTKSDPSVLCAYPNGGTRLAELRIRGPRVDFGSSIGEVGWVEWRTAVQRRRANGTWRTIGRGEPVRRTVTLGFSKTFPTVGLVLAGPAGATRMRLASRLIWFDQGNDQMGSARHVTRHYGWVRFGPGQADPIRFDDIEKRSVDSCPNLWAS